MSRQQVVLLTIDELNLIDARLALLENTTTQLKERIMSLTDTVVALAAEVTETRGAMASAKVLIEGFASRLAGVEAELAQVGVQSAALDQLRADLDAGSTELAAAVAANPLPETPTPPPAL